MTIGDYLGGNHSLKVTTETLITKADEVSENVREMSTHMSALENLVKSTNSYWIGEAGDLYRNTHQKQQVEIAKMLKRLAEHPVNLRQAAQLYEGVISNAEPVVKGLPTDVI